MERRILRSKMIGLLVLAVCILEVILSGRSINRTASSTHNWIYIGGLLFSIWIVSALALKAKLMRERFLFIFMSIAFVFWAAIAIILPSQQIVHIFGWIILLMWISAAVSGTAILFDWRDFK